jgi:Zn-finger nucleic acid-binding protein
MYVPGGRVAQFIEDPPEAVPGPPVEGEGVRCAADHSIMMRARVDIPGGDAIYLDRCSSCKGVWFDAGEWSALASAHLLDHLDEFWTAEWRSRQRHASEKLQYEQRMKDAFGDTLYARLLELAHELRGHPRRSQALAIIREESAH